MSRPSRLLLAATLFLLGACGTVPFQPTELVPATPATAAALCAGLWDAGNGKLLIRQSALFELQGMRVPMDGIMKLDPVAGSARLIGMNDMGAKLYDISVDRTSSQANFVIPELARYPGFAEAVAVSLRRIFLDPAPSQNDALTRNQTSYLLTRESGEGRVSFVLGGTKRQLLEKSCRGDNCSWRVRYFEHRRGLKIPFPGGIVLDDDRAGYRLTLWMENMEKTDE